MTTFLTYCLNCFYIPWFFLATLLFGLFCPLVFLIVKLKTGAKKDEIIRKLIHFYGSFLLFIAWPLIRVKRRGVDNLPEKSPCVVVVNHRSTVDMFFGSLFTPFNTTVFVRSWPFKIPGFKWFMNGAGYVDTENENVRSFLEGRGMELYKKGVSFLFYPEGHRSKDGKLQRFQSGAFLMATEFNIPVVPVCMKGTEELLPIHHQLFRPASVFIDILPPIYPATLPEEKRALKLRRLVESVVKKHLNE